MRTTPREVRDFANVKNLFHLSEKQKSVLLGTLLGDGSLKRRGKFHRLHIKHSYKQISLVRYKRKIFSNITNMPIRVFFQKVGGVNYKFCEFVTLTHPIFSTYYDIFYHDGKKIIPKWISTEFKNPLSLAMWFMDDGSAEYAGLSFNTQCFTLKEIDILRDMLKANFSLETTCRRNKNGWIIYILKKEVGKFVEIVDKFVLNEFKYKFIVYSQRHLEPRRDYTPGPDHYRDMI